MNEHLPGTPDSTSASAPQNNSLDAKPAEEPALISFEEFSKIKLHVAQILEAERVEKSAKLIRLQISLGEKLGQRQIVAGIGKHYEPQDLIGRKIVVVANLKPAKLMGQLSEGMLLAASDENNNLELLSPGDIISAGSRVG